MMKTTMTVQLRRFDVLVEDQRTRETREESIVFTLEQLHAAQLVGQSSKELICRVFERQGYKVLDIGRAERREATLRLDGLFWEADEVC